MTNREMFVYFYGIVLRKGTVPAWDVVHAVTDPLIQNWLNATYTETALSGMTLDKLVASAFEPS